MKDKIIAQGVFIIINREECLSVRKTITISLNELQLYNLCGAGVFGEISVLRCVVKVCQSFVSLLYLCTLISKYLFSIPFLKLVNKQLKTIKVYCSVNLLILEYNTSIRDLLREFLLHFFPSLLLFYYHVTTTTR